MEGREEEGEGGGEGWGTGDREDWIQGKSHMLDEVCSILWLSPGQGIVYYSIYMYLLCIGVHVIDTAQY